MKKLVWLWAGVGVLAILFVAGCAENNQVEVPNESSTLELSAIQCGRAFSVYPDNSAGNVGYFAAQSWTWEGVPGTIRSFIQFDLSGIPDNATITKAELYLYHNQDTEHSSLSSSNAAYLERVTSAWTGNSLCWNEQPLVTSDHRVSLEQSSSPTQDYVLDVTQMVGDMRQFGNYGMRLCLQTEQAYASMYFSSQNHANQEMHPKLVVTFHP